jgi:hypothetical protein
VNEPYGPWQRPGYDGADIYPPFACDDRMRAGGVNIGSTRQLVHDLLASIMEGGWEWAVESFGPQACEPGDYARFLHDLLNVRGEFGRLLLTLAAAERAENDRHDAVLDEATGGKGGLVNITPGDPEAVELPPPWWESPDLIAPVVAQLRRCLAILDDDPEPVTPAERRALDDLGPA